jgi:S-adenosylmethionine hydrolase
VAIVTFLSDFGHSDTYVGQVKGAILAIDSSATIVDLTHAVPPQDVRAGAFLLWTAVDSYSKGTVHLAVVDPGVGSPRRAIAVRSRRGDLFVGPDNGVLALAVQKLGGAHEAVELSQPRFWGPRRSNTFQGRDLFGPVAAHLAAGISIRELGSSARDLKGPFDFLATEVMGEAMQGEIIHVDGFGTLVTNIAGERLAHDFEATVRGRSILGRQGGHFALVPSGELIALTGSAGLIEVAVRDGSAAARLGASVGDPVRAGPLVPAQ